MVVAHLDAPLLDCHVGLRPPRNDVEPVIARPQAVAIQ
jgi:hypothetical protein